MSELTPLREAVDTLASRTLSPDFGDLRRRAARRGRRRVVLVAAATAAVIVGSVLAVTRLDVDRRTAPAVPLPRPVVGAVPVWYDAKGLHRGDVVEQTPVEIRVLGENTDTLMGALALVRSGAVYLDPATGEVWFHRWGGEARIVGHDSLAGPGGDPNGDTAAWFEGLELVVYDTAAGREISRTSEVSAATEGSGIGGEHFPAGDGFLQVSADRVVWTDGPDLYSHDLRTRRTSAVTAPKDLFLADVQGDVEAFGDRDALVLRVPGRADERYPELETHVRLSPSGNYLLAVEGTKQRHAAAIVDTSTGELWRVPKNAYPWIAWSYDDVALVDTEDALLACDAAHRTCERLPAERPFLMPTN
jgi:hypothetical protein